MVRISYVSKVAEDFGITELGNILRVSQLNNRQDDITGMLIYHHDTVLQILEGPEENVRKCYNRIRLDPRHSNIQPLDKRPVNNRAFTDWSMGIADLEDFHTLPSVTLHSFSEIMARLTVAKDLQTLPPNTHHVISTIGDFIGSLNIETATNGASSAL